MLNQSSILVKRTSCVYDTQALMPKGAPTSWKKAFLNLVVHIQTSLSPMELYHILKQLEKTMGRKDREKKWSPRIIDFDLLFFEDMVMESKELQIPHPCFHERFFTVFPAAQLFPYWKYPNPTHSCYGKTLLELTDAFRPYSNQFHNALVLQPKLVGVVNITPDSFSDGNKYLHPETCLKQVRSLHNSGASVIELGAQSTRPGSEPISAKTEWKRLAPALEKIKEQTIEEQIEISIDSYHYDVISQAMHQYDVRLINDVSGNCDEKIVDLVAKKEGKIVLMHSLGVVPRHKHQLPIDQNPLDALMEWGERMLRRCLKRGLEKSQIILDPGIGFGKHPGHSWHILSQIDALSELGCDIFLGHSRKSFLQWCTSAPPEQRDIETGAISLLAYRKKISYLRVHNVEMHQRLLTTATLMEGQG